jgi:hypothetical protein
MDPYFTSTRWIEDPTEHRCDTARSQDAPQAYCRHHRESDGPVGLGTALAVVFVALLLSVVASTSRAATLALLY